MVRFVYVLDFLTNLITHENIKEGANYTSRTFRTYFKELGIKSSFSGPGEPHDNAVMESFNKTLKNEEYYVKHYCLEIDLKETLFFSQNQTK